MINNFHDEKEMGILLNDNSLNEKDRVDIYYDLSNTKNHFTKVAKRFNNKFLTIKSINDNLYSTSQEPINIKTFYSNPYGAKNHRKPRNGKGRGLPKKGGAGGKGTWGKFGEDYSNENHACYIDKNDPNYDSECSQDIITEISIPELERHMLAAKVEPIIHEYFNHGNTQEVIKSLTELNIPLDLRPQVACLAIRIALDLKDSDRELTSILLSEFSHYTQHGNHKKSIYTESNSNILDGSNNFMLTRDHFKSAFQEILRNLDDYVMDIPGVAQIVGNFIARALADDCFDASIFSDMEAHFADKGPTRELIKHLLAYLVDVDDCLDYNSVDKGFERIIENLPELSYSIPNAQLLFEKFVEMCCEDDWENMINEKYANNSIGPEGDNKSNFCYKNSPIVNEHKMGPDGDFNGLIYSQTIKGVTQARFKSSSDSYSFASILTKDILTKIPNKGRKRFVSEGDEGLLKDTIRDFK
ncbi:programmed cell death protein 4-like isoform X4 [Gordionus sp. m RMFG-2023]|uniref:programmed cell death protein 4-like isoform X4 n=1 Tax=Gordionus sp. m RMFG-2023 TaxID=3053472 RepID=UPI0031FDE079